MRESLDPRLIYAKTAAGELECTQRSDALSPAARRVLLLVDGQRALAMLPAHTRPGELPQLIEELLAAGMIRLTGILEELPSGWTDARDPRLDDFKRRIAGVITRELGASGAILEARLQDCVNMTVMRAVMREVIELVRARGSQAAATRVAEAAQAANRAWARQQQAGRPNPAADAAPS